MADIDALRKKYFVQPDDTEPPSEPLPATFSGCLVTPLIDGAAYFNDLAAAITPLGTGTPSENSAQFIYITGWWVGFLGHPPLPEGRRGDRSSRSRSTATEPRIS
ncbi:hypothetical protein ACFQHO_51410 [Actinomadura yumaensis]|uniref:hypothetical protein n=1 Tax=Actinomadura yumaensis TaxID=111807 RepID=UPI0036084F1A